MVGENISRHVRFYHKKGTYFGMVYTPSPHPLSCRFQVFTAHFHSFAFLVLYS
jgi:hypothetical protein